MDRADARAVLCISLLLAATRADAQQPGAPESAKTSRSLSYFHDEVRDAPWSIHVLRFDRARADLELQSVLGHGSTLGMATVSEQVKRVPPECGRPVAAINGDFFHNQRNHPGDPEGLQIVRGELVSAPSSTRVCFWIDAAGQPHRGDVVSRLAVTWPDGRAMRLGLNEERAEDGVVLYTRALGPATHTSGGLEIALAPDAKATGQPLRIGEARTWKVRSMNTSGNTSIPTNMMVLSFGPKLLTRLPKIDPGTTLKISTATTPSLVGAKTAIGGGPTLVAEGKVRQWTGVQTRQPRTAIGWNREFFYLVEVDGRQKISAGMTFPELAAYMAKLGCREAMNLDGGGSATFWMYGNVMNSPSEGHERPAANALVLFQKDKADK